MNRVIFGIAAAGVSALTVYHWYSARKREVISSTDVDNLNGRSSVYPHVLSETGIRGKYDLCITNWAGDTSVSGQ